jgi:type III pantothenate kinase
MFPEYLLAIGNTRYHWAKTIDRRIVDRWDTLPIDSGSDSGEVSPLETIVAYLQNSLDLKDLNIDELPNIYLASVVPKHTKIWSAYPRLFPVDLSKIPLTGFYPTLGVDRALAAFGGGETYGYPILVVDGGTALTLTAIDDDRHFVGGAILPGLRLQFQSLTVNTGALPKVTLPLALPPLWSNDTPTAIASGILHTTIAGIVYFLQDWHKTHPHSQIVFTGGDGEYLCRQPAIVSFCPHLHYDPDVIFIGIILATYRLK